RRSDRNSLPSHGTSRSPAGWPHRTPANRRTEEAPMSATGLEVFDKTIHTTNIWLDDIMADMGPDRQFAWHVLGAVLPTLRARLRGELGAHLGARRPLIVRGAYYDQYQPAMLQDKTRSPDECTARLAGQVRFTRPVDPRDALAVVCAVMARHVD